MSRRSSLLAEAETASDPHRISEIHARLVDARGPMRPGRARAAILAGLGFDAEAQARPCRDFSGGWRMRVALAAVLFAQPDLLLLDEPTNHLDLEATLWLEGFLKSYPHAILLVSHDRDLLNKTVEKLIHLEACKLTVYTGGSAASRRRAPSGSPRPPLPPTNRRPSVPICRPSSTASATRRARHDRRKAG
jgi:ATP-binding cassette subfamily F protein 3